MSESKPKVLRGPDGKLLPGTKAMNPGGRPKGIERRMKELVEEQLEPGWDGRSLDGWEAMTMLMYKIAMGKPIPGTLDQPVTVKDRMAAVNFLFDRVHGKAKIQIESDNVNRTGGLANIDVENLTKEELEALEAHVEILAAKAEGKTGAGAIIDMPPDDLDNEEEP